jgi:DNA-directed RNA polymerase specialized sigma24 family protein
MERYCFGIARNLAKEKLRRLRREYTAFHKFIEAINNYSSEQVERIYSILKPCFEHLSVEEQQLLAEYCHKTPDQASAEHRRQLAETMQVTVPALRIKVTRLRNKLTDCVKKLSK